VPSLEEFNAQMQELQLEESQIQAMLQPDCASCPGLRDSISIFQDLVFVVRQDVDDLHFRLEHLDQCAEQIESLLSTLLYSLHSPDLGTNAPTSHGAVLATDFQTENE